MAAAAGAELVEDYLGDHPRYQQLNYLSRGLFGYVVLAMDKTKGSLVGRNLHQSFSVCITRLTVEALILWLGSAGGRQVHRAHAGQVDTKC